MKINELITTLEEKHIKEAGGFDVESDTIAKLQKNFPSWKLGMPHPESNEPTMTKQELIKFGIVDPKNLKNIDPQADPRYFGADGQERKAANKRAKDTFGDRPVAFSKSPTDYLTQSEWDYKYGRTHNPDGSPKSINPKNSENNPQALKNKQIKNKKLNSTDVKDLDKTIILFKTPGKFDAFSGIGSVKDVGVSTLQQNYKKLGAEKNKGILERYFIDQAHTVYGFVDSFRDKDVKIIDDENIEGIVYTGADKVKKGQANKLVPGQDKLPDTEGLSADYKNSIINYYKKLHKFYKPYFDQLTSNDPSFMDQRKWELQNYKPEADTKVEGIARIPQSLNMVIGIKNRLAGLGYYTKDLYMPDFGSTSSDLDSELKFVTIEPAKQVQVPDDADIERPKPKPKSKKSNPQQQELPLNDPEVKPKKKKADVVPIQTGYPEFGQKASNESIFRKALKENQPIRTDLEDIPELNPQTVQIVNPELANDDTVVPRPADPESGERGAPSKVARGDGLGWDNFTDETKKNWEKMYGGKYPTPTKAGLSEKEPGQSPNSDKSVKKRFFAIVSQDGVLYVQDEKDKRWYPSQNDLLYARAIERLYGLEIIDHEQGIFKGAMNVGTVLKRMWKGGGNMINQLMNKQGKPYDPGKTKPDYFDK